MVRLKSYTVSGMQGLDRPANLDSFDFLDTFEWRD